MDLITGIKSVFYTLLGWVTSMVFYFAPVHGLMIALSVAFFASFFFGILAGLIVQKEDVNLKKASVAFSEFANYLLILAALFVIGDKMQSKEWIFQILTWITWGMIYFYIANWAAPDYSTLCRRQKHIDIQISYEKSCNGLPCAIYCSSSIPWA